MSFIPDPFWQGQAIGVKWKWMNLWHNRKLRKRGDRNMLSIQYWDQKRLSFSHHSLFSPSQYFHFLLITTKLTHFHSFLLYLLSIPIKTVTLWIAMQLFLLKCNGIASDIFLFYKPPNIQIVYSLVILIAFNCLRRALECGGGFNFPILPWGQQLTFSKEYYATWTSFSYLLNTAAIEAKLSKQ